MSNDMGVMEFEVDARLAITDARFTPGQRYRVTVTPADAPKPEPVAWAARTFGGDEYEGATPFRAAADNWQACGIKVVPLYEHPPAEEVETLRKRIAELEAQLADAQKVENECHRGVVYGLESLVERITDTKDEHCFHEEDSPVAAAEKVIRAHFEHPPISAEPPTARELFEDGWRASFNVHKRYLEKNEDFASRNYDVSHELWTAIYDMEHPSKSETLAERMHREGWVTMTKDTPSGFGAWRMHGHHRQEIPIITSLYHDMRELETPPAVKIARQLHSEGWRTRGKGYVGRDIYPACCDWMTPRPAVYAAMREIEEEDKANG